ncbi:MAG: hypothetical protein LBS56_00290 [Propionibacteriaceae bacterium]|nr:hypothetical protein [Propionibacteriaceae bacterium]
MVFGLEKFARHFEGYEHNHVLIGGTACELVLANLGQPFRATKDLDIVLVAETIDAGYVARFLNFVALGSTSRTLHTACRPSCWTMTTTDS